MKFALFSAALAGFAASSVRATGTNGEAFILSGNNWLAITRMDPIVNPGAVGGHVHAIMGASNFRNILNDPSEQANAECSTVAVSEDMSNYWVPLPYFINANGTYSAMIGGTRIYYLNHSGAGSQKVQAFPRGMRMISGLAGRRDPGAIQTQGVKIYYVHGESTNTQFIANGTIQKTAPESITFNINFPYCGWANQSLDSDDHFSHMTWGIHGVESEWAVNAETCPDTHPIMYPQITINAEYVLEPWQKEAWNTEGPNIILSNGDVTGVTYHGDFVSGWDPTLLQSVIDDCGAVGSNLYECSHLSASGMLQGWGPDTANGKVLNNCRYQGQLVDEDVGLYRPIDKLPGCNPRWDWDGPNEKPTDCEEVATPGFVSPNLQYFGPWWTRFPLVLPNVDTSDPASMVPMSGNKGTNYAYLGDWATSEDGKTNVTNVLHGTQDEVNANTVQNDNNKKSLLYGVSDYDAFDSTVASIGLADLAVATVGAATTSATQTYQCLVSPPWGGLPCGPQWNYAATSAAAAATTSVDSAATTTVAAAQATATDGSSASLVAANNAVVASLSSSDTATASYAEATGVDSVQADSTTAAEPVSVTGVATDASSVDPTATVEAVESTATAESVESTADDVSVESTATAVAVESTITASSSSGKKKCTRRRKRSSHQKRAHGGNAMRSRIRTL